MQSSLTAGNGIERPGEAIEALMEIIQSGDERSINKIFGASKNSLELINQVRAEAEGPAKENRKLKEENQDLKSQLQKKKGSLPLCWVCQVFVRHHKYAREMVHNLNRDLVH